MSGDSCCTTEFNETEKGTFNWKIKGFRENFGAYNREGVRSSEFPIKCPGGRNSRWMLEIKPDTIKTDGEHLVTMWIKSNVSEVQAKITITLIDGLGNTVSRDNYDHVFDGDGVAVDSSEREIWIGIYWETVMSNPSKYLPDGDLNIMFEVTTHGSQTTTCHYQKLSENFREFFLSKEMSDIQIKCRDKTFDAHQLILFARSPVFRGMFQAEMKEKESQLVVIEDFKPDVVEGMLKFIYSGTLIQGDLEMVPDLLQASDKYQIDILKEKCESVLISNLHPESSLEFLVLSDMHGAKKLKKRALDLVVNNMNTIRRSAEWKECAKKRPHLFVDISEAMADVM